VIAVTAVTAVTAVIAVIARSEAGCAVSSGAWC
jgi:hypothetical protein